MGEMLNIETPPPWADKTVGSGTNAGIEAMFAPGVHLEFENPFT
jgi:hypothetical protein